MKPTQTTELFANIKATFVSFFSIFMFVALGVGVFLGITWAGPALENAAQSAFQEGNFHDFQVQYPFGLTESDLEQLKSIEGVTDLEAGHQSFQELKIEGTGYTVKVQSLNERIDVPIVQEGSLPNQTNEIALNTASAKQLGLGVGSTIVFEHDADPNAVDLTSVEQQDDANAADSAQKTSSSGMKYLTGDTYMVTAIIDTADYLAKSPATFGYSNSPSGAVDAVAWVTDNAFNPQAYQDGYPIVNMTCDNLVDKGTYTNEYDKAAEPIEDRINVLGAKLGDARYDDLHSQAKAKVEDAEKQLAEGKQKIADGEKQLVDGRTELETKKTEGQQKLDDAYRQLQNAEALKAQGEQQLAEGRAKVQAGESALAEIDAAKAKAAATIDAGIAKVNDLNDQLAKKKIDQKQYDAALDALGKQLTSDLRPYAERAGTQLPTIDHTNIKDSLDLARSIVDQFEYLTITYEGQTMTVAEARNKLADARNQLASGEAEYNQRVAQLNQGWAEYNAGQEEYNRLVAEGEQKLADGEKELEDAKAKVAENEPKVQAAREQYEKMKKSDWSVLPRAFNAGAAEISTFSGVTGSLSYSMAALFIIVGLLVSYFAVSRIVHEQVIQIGTKKALGFRKGEITKSFLLYSGIAVLAGSIIGALVGYSLVEGIIGGVLGGMFTFGTYPAYFSWPLFTIMVLLELALILGATYLACRHILKQHAIELLRGEKPPSGKERFYERWGLWDRLPLFVQTIVNNCVNDRRRMLSTVVGVAGATALIVTAITLNNDVLKSYDMHYSNVYGFDTITYVKSNVDDAAENVQAALEEQGATTGQVFMKRYLIEQPDGKSAAMRIVVPQDEESFLQVYHINPMTSGTVDLSQKGAWVSQAYADHMGAKVGDVIIINSGDGDKHEVPILGFYEFWLTYHEMVVGADYFHEEFGESPTNAVLANRGDASFDDLKTAASQVEGFSSIINDSDYQYGNFATFSKVSSAVVAIYLVLAALMAMVVLLNLNFMFIDEKKREIIVLMINGFSVKDAKKYIAFDSVVLTAIGIIVGIVLGCIAGSATVAAIEPSTASFFKGIDGWAVLIGILGSAALAIIMGEIALRRIPKFKLTDINKA